MSLTLSGFTQGDTITCVLDMEAKTLAFGKNDEVMINCVCIRRKKIISLWLNYVTLWKTFVFVFVFSQRICLIS